jgi:hypothetical protein
MPPESSFLLSGELAKLKHKTTLLEISAWNKRWVLAG